ncbi:Uncharacterised protein [Bordetella pertussis]|nr:Uncharacterised protein [Bordetella pertussis]CPO76266.1 Uncharacterised protein [Bordetella pertussis]CRE05779.1 Uncharacterised protein [Bordetella pertussis]
MPPASAGAAPPSRSRPITVISSTTATSAAAENAATRQLASSVMVVMNTGVRAQPRLPVSPCRLNAWPSRGGLTRWLMME